MPASQYDHEKQSDDCQASERVSCWSKVSGGDLCPAIDIDTDYIIRFMYEACLVKGVVSHKLLGKIVLKGLKAFTKWKAVESRADADACWDRVKPFPAFK